MREQLNTNREWKKADSSTLSTVKVGNTIITKETSWYDLPWRMKVTRLTKTQIVAVWERECDGKPVEFKFDRQRGHQKGMLDQIHPRYIVETRPICA